MNNYNSFRAVMTALIIVGVVLLLVLGYARADAIISSDLPDWLKYFLLRR
ncbi:MAG: hypothetical protein IKK09_01540 [Clostridia bacterium]|nr:hypothetical protein [Clostridia bacterium]